jgi:adenylate kinase family enzyme
LRSHPEQLAAYIRLKNDLARRHPDDIDAYTDGKTGFIREMDKRAAASRSFLPEAIILLGPTGSGKTPLGAFMEKEGLAGRKCFHFDFGSRLRLYAAHPTGRLSESELAVVNNSLLTGALLTDEQFPIAEKLLDAFITENNIGDDGLVVLNGLPRHAGQAAALEKIVRITAVVILQCDAKTVLERVRTNAGGDRAGRIDDTLDDVERKLAIFNEKTLPLVSHYQTLGIRIVRIFVGPRDRAEDTRNVLNLYK